MKIDELPDLVLHEICLYLEAKDITSIQETNHKLFRYIRANRQYYSKNHVWAMRITTTEDGGRKVSVIWFENRKLRMTLKGSVEDVMKSFAPERLLAYDHDELANMSALWWNQIIWIHLYNIVDIRRYMPYFDRFTTISLNSNTPMNLSEILAPMETKNLFMLCMGGNGELECTDEDFRKIGRLSNKMLGVRLGNTSDSSNISNDAILDMIEIGSYEHHASIYVPQIRKGIRKCLKKRDWVVKYKKIERSIKIKKKNRKTIWIRLLRG